MPDGAALRVGLTANRVVAAAMSRAREKLAPAGQHPHLTGPRALQFG